MLLEVNSPKLVLHFYINWLETVSSSALRKELGPAHLALHRIVPVFTAVKAVSERKGEISKQGR